jgi:hypothetical protein
MKEFGFMVFVVGMIVLFVVTFVPVCDGKEINGHQYICVGHNSNGMPIWEHSPECTKDQSSTR